MLVTRQVLLRVCRSNFLTESPELDHRVLPIPKNVQSNSVPVGIQRAFFVPCKKVKVTFSMASGAMVRGWGWKLVLC